MPELNDPLAVTLSIGEWNQVLQILGDGAYKVVAPLVAKINIQANAVFGEAQAGMPNGPGNVEHLPAMPPAGVPAPSRRPRQQD